MTYIEASNISKSFPSAAGPRHVLERASLSVARGEFVSIVGFMGCGKSTLLNILSGVIRADTGEIRIDGSPVVGVYGRASIVFQNYSLLPWFSAYENVRLAVHAAHPEWSRAEQRQQAEHYLALVGLGNAMHRRPNQLSGGMRQRVAIARAFATEPEVLFLDEPFGALDALTRANLQQELARLCSPSGLGRRSAEREGGRPVTTVMISNNLDEALLLSDRIIPMTPAPRATLGSPVAVELPRPRSVELLLHDVEAVRARTHVVESLTEHVHAANEQRAKARSRTARATAAFVAADSREADV
ncbi:MAG: ABC transporter ATP-binding protein [Acidobacteria bacterium]|nr:MAG: ABC transporter ATP-binding protein [Acidobacteriota bacterium]